MTELLQAAKAVIEDLGFLSDASIDGLRAAVERAEKQEAMSELAIAAKLSTALYKEGYEDGQQAERERIKELIRLSRVWHGATRMTQANWLLERIDAN